MISVHFSLHAKVVIVKKMSYKELFLYIVQIKKLVQSTIAFVAILATSQTEVRSWPRNNKPSLRKNTIYNYRFSVTSLLEIAPLYSFVDKSYHRYKAPIFLQVVVLFHRTLPNTV